MPGAGSSSSMEPKLRGLSTTFLAKIVFCTLISLTATIKSGVKFDLRIRYHNSLATLLSFSQANILR